MNDDLDYIENSHNFDFQDMTDEKVEKWGNLLFQSDIPLDEKKKALGILANVGNLIAYKHLKKYAGQPDKELETWASLALGECTLFLHGDLSGEDEQDFVYTGVGPHNNMIRIYFLLLPVEDGQYLEAWQHKVIENEMNYVARDLKCELEWFDFKPSYTGFSLLMPINMSAATIIEKGIANCNQFGGFLLEEYYCGTGVPDEKEIEEIIQIVRYGEEETVH
jgi:hypothetical protein